MEAAGGKNELRIGAKKNRSGRLRESLPISEERLDAVRVQTRKLVKVRLQCPTCVLKALRELTTIYITLYLDDEDASITRERHNVGAPPVGSDRLSTKWEERDAGELFEVLPQQFLDVALIELWAGRHLAIGDDFVSPTFEDRHVLEA